MAKTEKNADTPPVPHVRVTTGSIAAAVECGGQLWAGISEVPRSTISDAQLAALKADKRLQVEVFDRPVAVDPEAAAD